MSEYNVDDAFCTSPEYFKAIATTHRFIRDILSTNDENYNNHTSKKAMIALLNKYKEANERVHLYSIIRLTVVAALNLDIVKNNGKEMILVYKLYRFLLENLISDKNMIDYVYNIYNINLLPTEQSTSSIEQY
jgi:hypothetical protein